jgi:hypothetical protein
LGDARHDEAADHFTAAINLGAFSSKNIHWIYDDDVAMCQDDAYLMLFITECFVQLFGWDLPSLLLTMHQKSCSLPFAVSESVDPPSNRAMLIEVVVCHLQWVSLSILLRS